MKLLIEVELGNDAMQTAADAGHALAKSWRDNCDNIYAPLSEGDEGSVRDENGNTVGAWKVAAE